MVVAVQSYNLKKLRQTLLDVISSSFELKLLAVEIGAETDLRLDHSLAVAAFDLIQWAVTRDRLGELLAIVLRHHPEHQGLRALVQQLPATGDAETSPTPLATIKENNPLQATLLPNGKPFLDRRVLRHHLGVMLSKSGPNILIVHGGDGVGKSYTFDFIAYLSVALQSFRVASFNLAASAYVTVDPTELALHLVSQVSPDADLSVPAAEETSPRYVLRLADWLLSRVAQTKASWWFVLDGFDHPDLRPDTQDLLRALLISVARDPRVDLKIVLLGCSEDLVPLAIEGKVLSDPIEPLEKRDIVEFFEQLTKSNPVHLAADQVALIAEAVFARGRAPRMINQALMQVMDTLQKETG